jgi:hypothetical protein
MRRVVIKNKASSCATKGFLRVLLHIIIGLGWNKYQEILKIKMMAEFKMAAELISLNKSLNVIF